jgi:hypothetical protein
MTDTMTPDTPVPMEELVKVYNRYERHAEYYREYQRKRYAENREAIQAKNRERYRRTRAVASSGETSEKRGRGRPPGTFKKFDEELSM